jgi:outer membrane immunogenic protein
VACGLQEFNATYDKVRIGERRGSVSMHRTFSAGVIFALSVILPAFAADLAMKAPAIQAAPVQFSWTGCHLGADIGGAFSYDKIRSSGDFSSVGFIGGGQIGCDYQFAPAWIIGVEGRAAWSSLKSNTPGSVTFPALGVTVPTQFTVSNDFLASATARVGYSFVDRWLVFVRGGAAWTVEKADDAFSSPLLGFAVDPKATMTRTGWTAGTGVEWAFAPHWSASFEYNYYDFGGDFILTDPANGAGVSGNLKDRIHTVTAGVTYHF